MADELFAHLFLKGYFQKERYIYAGQLPVREPNFPVRNRTVHGTLIRDQLIKAREENGRQRGSLPDSEEILPIILEIQSEPGFSLKLDSFEDRRKGIEIACVRKEKNVQVATVHVPKGSLGHFLKRVEDYLTSDTKGTPKTPPRPKHQELIETISRLKLATLRSFWTDENSEFPSEDQAIWWEVWLQVKGKQSPWKDFGHLAQANHLKIGTDSILFPDRQVGLVFGTAKQLSLSPEILDLLGELRKAKENPLAFVGLSPKDQGEWVAALLPRIKGPPADSPAVCLLDGGVLLNPLVNPALNAEDCHQFDPTWPVADGPVPNGNTHGTEMAGLALFGDRLAAHLASNNIVTLQHRLESVRILPPKPLANEPRLYGFITSQAASLVEIAAPQRNRTFCLPVTSDGKDHGKPTSWSGVIDQMCAGIGDTNPRLFIISSGNTDPNERHRYPDSNDTDPIQDPAQSWNAITVGAYTNLWEFDQNYPTFADCVPIARPGDLSPSSTTSLTWDKGWPYKPDIVLEGGNQIHKPGTTKVFDPEQMALLTTSHATTGPLLVNFRDTSAAAAQAARMASILQANYPDLWPETIRALLVHSAEWTEVMRGAFGTKQRNLVSRLQRYGYGVPNLDRALYSARNSLTLIAQQSIKPFSKEGNTVKTRDMGLHDLPWPKDQLLEMGEKLVTMRVTLS